ncbi:hypothetical protein FA15DRAFT_112692 [Coprinopsis marcescibilis]|uniref:Nephrocystin 3-like N-terminal domain-containing protein n=1 Tax=Coprinopsis marcescibilis TaxID=230819 RepID=A0A5C3KL98_COPMA|nr:hypothetical protein FA15DRAFT_112692 [Coprinopsis marcescibilis]
MWTWIHSAMEDDTLTAASELKTQMYLVADAVGSGKSSLLHTICQRTHQQGILLASFFDQMNDQSTVSNFLAVLIRGLCSVDEHVLQSVGEILCKDSSLTSAGPQRQFQAIVVPAAKSLPPDRAFVLTIDALDEEDDEVLLIILRDPVPHLPPNLRVIATTRSEPHIMQRLKTRPHVHFCLHSLTGPSNSNRQDLTIYTTQRLNDTEFGDKVSESVRDEFMDKSEGVFLWAATVLNHLERAYDPICELKDILKGRSAHWVEDGNAVPRLDSLYSDILSKVK